MFFGEDGEVIYEIKDRRINKLIYTTRNYFMNRISKAQHYKERTIEMSLLLSAMLTILILAFIAIFIFQTGWPIMAEVGVLDFIFGDVWRPLAGVFGIFPMIIGTFLVVFGALLLGAPTGIMCGTFLAEIAPRRVRDFMRPTIELLIGIPTVVYGFFGLVVLVPLIRIHLGGPGFSILAGSIILGIMILPIIIAISEDGIRAIPHTYKEASLALGATHWQTIRNVLLPAARSTILTGVILGFGRAIGETMAVIMVLGNTPILPDSILAPARALTANIAMEMAYATGDHRQALFATGIVLFAVILLLNLLINAIRGGKYIDISSHFR